MFVAQFSQAVVTAPAVGAHGAPGLDHLPDRWFKAFPGGIVDSTQSNSASSVESEGN